MGPPWQRDASEIRKSKTFIRSVIPQASAAIHDFWFLEAYGAAGTPAPAAALGNLLPLPLPVSIEYPKQFGSVPCRSGKEIHGRRFGLNILLSTHCPLPARVQSNLFAHVFSSEHRGFRFACLETPCCPCFWHAAMWQDFVSTEGYACGSQQVPELHNSCLYWYGTQG